MAGGFHVETQSSAELSEERYGRNWVDATTCEAESRCEQPLWTFHKRETMSRLDLSIMSGAAVHLLLGYEVWDRDNCSGPNHKMQCAILRRVGH